MENLFTPVDVDQTIPENAFETLVGEDKKFKDPEALAKAKLQSDAFIEQLKHENAELREATQKAMTLEEIKTMITSQFKPAQDPQTPNGQPPATPPAPKVNDSDLENLVASLLEKKESERRAKTNQEKVTEVLRTKYGTDAQMILNQKAKELNLPLEYLSKVANDSPTAFFRLIGAEESVSQPPVGASPRSTQTAPVVSNDLEAYWSNMKKNNPREYFNQENTMKRYKDAMAGKIKLK